MIICDANKCTGCMACVNICPKQCISMKYDLNFELHPAIGENCISCGKCVRVCPSNNPHDNHKHTTTACFAAYSKAQRDGTSSGGLATALSKHFVENDGFVCGAIFDGSVHHVLTNDTAVISAMRGSKYVQSVIGDCYTQIKKLISSRKCLFIGTPCQVAALKSVVGDSENLFCIDLICHGVPSPKFFNDILSKFEVVNSVSFRKKDNFSLIINGYQSAETERYMTAFLSEMNYRESCYQCQYAERMRVGDLTLGDFWEIRNYIGTEKGVSCVLVNTPKGEQMINAIKDDLCLETRNVSEAYAGNPQLNTPSVKHRNREKFLRILKEKDFDVAVKSTMKKELIKNWLKKRYIVKCLIKLKSRRRK